MDDNRRNRVCVVMQKKERRIGRASLRTAVAAALTTGKVGAEGGGVEEK